MSEQWRPVVGFEGRYEVSDLGQVRSIARRIIKRNGVPLTVAGGALNPWLSHGYPTVTLRDGRNGKTRQVHRLVLEAFVGPCPDGLEGCHNDGDPTDNCLSNLRWDTSSANKHDIVRHGRHVWASKTECPLGHRLEEPNLVRASLALGARQCRACNRARAHVKRHGGSVEDTAEREYARLMGVAA